MRSASYQRGHSLPNCGQLSQQGGGDYHCQSHALHERSAIAETSHVASRDSPIKELGYVPSERTVSCRVEETLPAPPFRRTAAAPRGRGIGGRFPSLRLINGIALWRLNASLLLDHQLCLDRLRHGTPDTRAPSLKVLHRLFHRRFH
jgi:hypothetical protein